jgi:hypothetical protein
MKIRGLHVLVVSLVAINCTGELPISDLINNTITLKVMGTYESNDPYGNLTLPKDDIITGTSITNASPALTGTPDIVTYANSLTASNIKYFIDLAEIRLAQGQGQSSNDTVASYWSQFAIDRQLMCSEYATADGRTLSNCAAQNGIDRLAQFFDGGFTYPAVDVATGTFNHMGIYFRRFNTSPTALFNGDGSYFGGQSTAQTSITAAFDNRTTYALDIESYLQNQYNEAATEPRMFPLQRKDLSLTIVDDHEPYVMEVRVFLKNLMMVHVIQSTGDSATPTSTSNSAWVFVAPADWNTDHAFKDATNRTRMGGSVLMTARTYQPAKVGSIVLSGTGNSGEYFAVTKSSVTLTTPNAVLPLAATRATNTTITNLPPDSYNVYRVCDKEICSNSSTAGGCDRAGGTDGYPETVQLCSGGPYTVSTGTATSVTLGNCAGSCP